MLNYLSNLAAAISRLANAVIGGTAAYTLSSRAEMSKRKWPKKVINGLFFRQDDHCKSALNYDKQINRSEI